jgi:hypothetical protein
VAQPLERRGEHTLDLVVGEECQQRLLRRACVERQPAAGLDREAQRLGALDAFEADRPVSGVVRDGQQCGLVGLARDATKNRQRPPAQVEHRAGAVAERERRRAEPEASRPLVPGEVLPAGQRDENPMRRRHRQPGGAGDLARAPLGAVGAEEIEDGERPVERLERRCAVL